MEFHQLFDQESSTYTYLVADNATHDAIIIDPVMEKLDRDIRLIKELNYALRYILETHVHADHVTAAAKLRTEFGAKVGLGQGSGVDCADFLLKDGQRLEWGSLCLTAWESPGHTNGCMCYVMSDRVFTGDALMIRTAGRTDFQQGSAENLYDSIQRLYGLPDDTLVFPAHDYQGISSSTIGMEKKWNVRIPSSKSKQEFVAVMNGLTLKDPKKIKISVPANLKCGDVDLHG